MRIVSRFRDYYDIGLGLGYDSHVDYIRTPREVLFKDGASPEKQFFGKLNFHKYWHYGTFIEYVVIGFCGEFYPLVIATKNSQKTYCYSLEELAKVIEISRWNRHKEFYETVRTLKNDELFIANYSPTVVVELAAKATWNGFLKPYGFMRIIDPYQAFQKIEMFLGNMAAPEKPIPKQSDIEKVKSHGFDPKMGFRRGRKDD